VFDRSEGWARLKAGITFQHLYDGDDRGYFEPGGIVTYHINRLGFRGPMPENQPRPGARRIVLLGDSFTFGEGVHWPDTFAARLSRQFASATSRQEMEHPGGGIECINLAVPGTDTRDQLEILRRVGIDLRPDLVVLVFTCNDFLTSGLFPRQGDELAKLQEAEFNDVVGMYLGQYEPARGPAQWSRLYDLLARRWQQRRLYNQWVETMVGSQTEPARQAIWQGREEQLRRMRELCGERGSNFAIVLFPTLVRLDADYPLRPLHRKLEEFCRAEQIPLLDLLEPLSRFEDRTLWVHPTDHHPNERAHEIAAEALGPFLRRQLPAATARKGASPSPAS
jgi:lysophospholipase L1-like esterase